jgi:magnesium chelatase subunit D/magnesium chelatase subunit I
MKEHPNGPYPSPYPFSAIVGQEKMKNALFLCNIDPTIGGVLIRGEKGTAKTTAVRGLAHLLPESEVVELPLGATEDRVVGSIDIDRALRTGEKKFEPGILSHAHENILYIDEVNLLEDHIVDIILDAAAMGVNYVEREGISYSHPSRFVLVGTMNPEEGDLRPQLIDRFGLSVEVTAERDAALRTEVMKRRLAYEKDPAAFCLQYEKADTLLRETLSAARDIISAVEVPEPMYEQVTQIALRAEVDGHRADITILKAGTCFAALRGSLIVEDSDIRKAAELALPHRMRRTPFDETEYSLEKIIYENERND